MKIIIYTVLLLCGIGFGWYIGLRTHNNVGRSPQEGDKAAAIVREVYERKPDTYKSIVLTTFHPTGHVKSIILADSAEWYTDKGFVDLVNPVVHEFNPEGKLVRRMQSKTGKAFISDEHEVKRVRMRGNFKMETWK